MKKLADRLIGRQVITMGFSLFGQDLDFRASCSRGVISSSPRAGGSTVSMLQTTCCVQSGASGGPIIDCATGHMLGLVVSNVLSSPNGLYPRFNMAVPSTLLKPALLRYFQTQGFFFLLFLIKFFKSS